MPRSAASTSARRAAGWLFRAVEADGSFSVDEEFRLDRAVSAGRTDRQARTRTPRAAGS
jgi:hypothetical protein